MPFQLPHTSSALEICIPANAYWLACQHGLCRALSPVLVPLAATTFQHRCTSSVLEACILGRACCRECLHGPCRASSPAPALPAATPFQLRRTSSASRVCVQPRTLFFLRSSVHDVKTFVALCARITSSASFRYSSQVNKCRYDCGAIWVEAAQMQLGSAAGPSICLRDIPRRRRSKLESMIPMVHECHLLVSVLGDFRRIALKSPHSL